MIYKKLLLYLAGVITILSIGANIFLYRKVIELSDRPFNEAAKEAAASTYSPDSAEYPAEQAVEKTDVRTINELEYQLKAAEEELDMVNALLDEVLEDNNTNTVPEKNQKTGIVNNIRRNIDRDYARLYKRLDLSPEDLDEFKRIVLEWRLANQERVALLSDTSNPENMKKAARLRQENRDRYNQQFIDLMGEEKFLIYDGFKNSGLERNEFNLFAANMPPEYKISDDNAEELIYRMYEARKNLLEEMNFGDVYNSSDSNEVKVLRMIERDALVYEKYQEISRSILPPDQAEMFNAGPGKKIEQYEEQKKMILLALEGKKDKEDIAVIIE